MFLVYGRVTSFGLKKRIYSAISTVQHNYFCINGIVSALKGLSSNAKLILDGSRIGLF